MMSHHVPHAACAINCPFRYTAATLICRLLLQYQHDVLCARCGDLSKRNQQPTASLQLSSCLKSITTPYMRMSIDVSTIPEV
eukprot:3309043-Amphidinium_carterae.1